MNSAHDLIVQRAEGLYCPQGDFYIDPWRPVERAVITHAHADHSRRGHGRYLAAAPAECVLRTRLLHAVAHEGTAMEPAQYAMRPWRERFLERIAQAVMRVALAIQGKRTYW